jgi:polygalacturonase
MVDTGGGRLYQRRGAVAFVAANKALLAAAWVVGAVGDGRAVNTAAFERAVEAIAALAERGGGQLNVPPGRWLTAPFNLTSHMTLFLAEGAEILGITVKSLLFL